LSVDLKGLTAAARLDEALRLGRRRKQWDRRTRRAVSTPIERHHLTEQKPARA
jgi:hypothetical protein